MGPFVPHFEGELTLDPLPEDFTTRIQRRVESGLLAPGHRERANYDVTAKDRSIISFAARGLLTNYNVGLNEVTVSRSGGDRIRYQVSYWGWTRIAVVHGLILGAVLAGAVPLHAPLRRDLASYPHGGWIFAGMVVFWCLIWPWLLTAFHKPHAERALQRILRETLSGPPAGSAPEGAARRAS